VHELALNFRHIVNFTSTQKTGHKFLSGDGYPGSDTVEIFVAGSNYSPGYRLASMAAHRLIYLFYTDAQV
jgi:hypothetical protein